VLDWAQGPEQAKKAFERAILDAMVLFAVANGLAVDAPELAKIHQIYQEMTNMTTTDENNIMARVDQLKFTAKSDGLMMYFTELAHHLSQDQKDMIIKAVVRVALADGDLKVKGEVLLLQVGDGLGVKVTRVKEIVRAESHHPRENNKISEKTKEEEESRSGKVSCVKQIMRADYHRPTKNHDIPEEDEEVEA
jgi:uncharacterized tellurite resistance protein B-like protein